MGQRGTARRTKAIRSRFRENSRATQYSISVTPPGGSGDERTVGEGDDGLARDTPAVPDPGIGELTGVEEPVDFVPAHAEEGSGLVNGHQAAVANPIVLLGRHRGPLRVRLH